MVKKKPPGCPEGFYIFEILLKNYVARPDLPFNVKGWWWWLWRRRMFI